MAFDLKYAKLLYKMWDQMSLPIFVMVIPAFMIYSENP